MAEYDVVFRNGTLYDGSGAPPRQADVAISGDRIAEISAPGTLSAKAVIDADGLAVAPGFINMLSWSVDSLIEDGRSQSEIREGVTLEVMGEGRSMGPYSEAMIAAGDTRGILVNDDIHYDVQWTTLSEYLEFLQRKGVSCNVASFVGTTTLRIHAMGYHDRPPTDAELNTMRGLVQQSMEGGAVGLSAALIYSPAYYADTDELIALAQVAADYDGLYISHLRSEAGFFLEALEELISISRVTGIRAEVYHLKAAGREHWPKIDDAIRRIEGARADGLPITADMYLYRAGGTQLNTCLPPWVHEGGMDAILARLRDPDTRARIKREMNTPTTAWENTWLEVDGPESILLAAFKTDALKPYTGKTLAEISALRGTPPEDTLLDLLVEDGGRIFTVFFLMSEENIRKQIQLPWVSFCSDAESQAPEGAFIKSNPHPRAYGNFARLLGHYVRDEALIPLEHAIHRLTALPAANLKLDRRGALKPGYFADVVAFDPATILDRATYDQPHQYAVGMKHVLVNGVHALKDGEHTGATPGCVVRGPGWTGRA